MNVLPYMYQPTSGMNTKMKKKRLSCTSGTVGSLAFHQNPTKMNLLMRWHEWMTRYPHSQKDS